MQLMRSFDTESRIQAMSVPEIIEAYEDLVHRVGKRAKFRGKKLQGSHVLNAILLGFLARAAQVADDQAVALLDELASYLEGRESVAEWAARAVAGPEITSQVKPVEPEGKAERRRSR